MTRYTCQTCGLAAAQSADAWAWHRLVEHPRMGLPVHRPQAAHVPEPLRGAILRGGGLR